MGRLPRGVEWVLRAGLPADQREPIAGDLQEEYAARVRAAGVARATIATWWQAARLALMFRWERSARGRPLPPIADEIPRRLTVFESMTQDLFFAARLLRRQPGFTCVAVLMLALGIGADTAIFGVVDAVLWRPLPYPDSDRVLSIAEQRPREGRLHGPVAPDDFYDWRRDAKSFTAMAAAEPVAINLSGGGEPERLRAIFATPGFFDVLGIAPALGRDFLAEEETPGRHRVVLLSDGVWRRRFGADPSIVGQSIALNGAPSMVLGVLPPAFWWPTQPDVVMPYASVEGGEAMRAQHSMEVVARLKPDVPFEQARAELDAIGKRLSEKYPQTNGAHFPHVVLLQDAMVGQIRPALLVLLGAVAIVLLIACANVATLLLARATGRQREIGVRIALGAGRGRLVRQMLTESLLLAIVGGAAGLMVAWWSIAAFRASLPASFLGLPGIARISIDARVITVAFLVSLATGLVFGMIPALAASDQRTAATLHEHGRGGAGIRSGRTRAALVVAEMALSLVLLVGAGLMLVSFKNLLDVSPGFEPRHLVATPLVLPGNRYNSHAPIVTFHQSLLERLRAMPGVEAADVVTALPFGGADSRSGFRIEGRTGQSPIPIRANWRLVSPGYLSTLGVPLVRGRMLAEHDADGSPDVVLINAAAARRFWPNEDPIGRRITFVFGAEPRWIEIVGVVGDVKHAGLDAESNPEAYLPFFQETNFWPMARNMTVVVRTRADAAMLAPMIRAAVAELDRNQPVGVASQMDALIARSIAPRRLNLWLVSAFAMVALVLTGAGLYGVMAYLVAQRSHEIGVRMALGASPRSVVALVMRQAGVMTLAGIVIGLAGAAALSRFVAGLLFGVSATEPSVYAGVSIVLAVVALAAVAIPSAWATRVDPITALRES